MARRRASMREGPLAELFKATEAAQQQAAKRGETDEPVQQTLEDTVVAEAPGEPEEMTVEHVPNFEDEAAVDTPEPPTPTPDPMPEPPPAARVYEMPEAPPILHR